MPYFQIYFLHDPCYFQFHSEHHSMLIRNNSIHKKYIDLKPKDSKIKSFWFVIDCLQTSNMSQNRLFICFVYMLSVASCLLQLNYPSQILACSVMTKIIFFKKKKKSCQFCCFVLLSKLWLLPTTMKRGKYYLHFLHVHN